MEEKKQRTGTVAEVPPCKPSIRKWDRQVVKEYEAALLDFMSEEEAKEEAAKVAKEKGISLED